MLIQPSQADVRRFFCSVHAKASQNQPLEPIEALAAGWILEHPEFHAQLQDVDAAIAQMHTDGSAQTNPFLHLSMHLSVSEQCSIDQPRGIRRAVEMLAQRRNSLHLAHHEVMESLGEMIWESQRSSRPPDGDAYVARVLQRASRD